MTRAQIRAEAEQEAQDFAERVAELGQETSGVPRRPKIEVSETSTDVSPFDLNFEAPETESQAPSAGEGGGGETPPPPDSCPALTSILISGISINPGCYIGDNGACNNSWSNKWQDISLNGFATITSSHSLTDWCGPGYGDDDCIWIFNTGIIRVYNYGPLPNPDPPPPTVIPSHCDNGSPSPYDSVVEGAIVRLGGRWYATIRNTDYGPAANNVPFIIFNGNGGLTTPTIFNDISGFDTSCNQYTHSGVIDDLYWGECTTGSGTDNWAHLGSGGSIVVTV